MAGADFRTRVHARHDADAGRVLDGKPALVQRTPDHPLLRIQATAGNGALLRAMSTAGGNALDATTVPGSRPIPNELRAAFEHSAGVSLGAIRLHDDADAAVLSREQDALAVTCARDIFIDRTEVDLTRPSGQFVLAHEIAHALQPLQPSGPTARREGDSGLEVEAHRFALNMVSGRPVRPPTQQRRTGEFYRFERSERNQIAGLDAVVQTARSMAESALRTTRDRTYIDQSDLVHAAGGQSVGDALAGTVGSESHGIANLRNRYLYTCGCGLIDMRHFYQLAYIAGILSNSTATQKGREHELGAEATSRFAAEDTPSNALGAYFGSQETFADTSDPAAFVQHLRVYLSSCHPVDFAGLSPTDQDAIVDFYAARNPAGAPANPNETATPQRPRITACGSETSTYPFVVDPSDPKTVTGQVAPYSLTSDAEIRTWLAGQTDTAIAAVPSAERERLINRLLDGWISEGDLGGVERLLRTAAPSDRAAIAGRVRPRADELWNDDQKRRLLTALVAR